MRSTCLRYQNRDSAGQARAIKNNELLTTFEIEEIKRNIEEDFGIAENEIRLEENDNDHIPNKNNQISTGSQKEEHRGTRGKR